MFGPEGPFEGVAAHPAADTYSGCGKDAILDGTLYADSVAHLNIGESDRIAAPAEGGVFVGGDGVRSIIERAG